MAVKGWDNIYDFNFPSEKAKPGDVVLQPVHDTAHQIPTFNKPVQYKNLPSEKDKFLYERDPEEEAQLPSLNLDHSTPNQPPRKAFISDQDPEHKDDPDRFIEDSKTPHTTGPDHIRYQPQTLPDPYIEVIARSIVAEYNLCHNPIELDVNRNKVSWTLPELVAATSNLSTKYEPNCTAKFKKIRSDINRYDFIVKCGEKWSDTSGHIVKVKFVPVDKRINKAQKTPLLVSCSCNFWRFYGCQYNSTQQNYNESDKNLAAPKDKPKGNGKDHLICKHVASCIPLIKFVLLKKQ